MGIREKGYAHWEGERVQRKLPWWPIARTGIRLTFQKKFFKLTYALTLLPAVVFLVGIYFSERLDEFKLMIGESSEVLQVNPAFFKTYLTNEFFMFMIAILLVLAGAGLISDDLKFNSMQLYFSRPIKKSDYLMGKATILAFFMLLLTLVPGLILFIMKIIFSGSLSFIGNYPWLPLSIICFSLLLTVFFSSYTLLLSSLSRNRRYVVILIVGVYFFSDILFGIFYGMFKNPYFSLLSIKVNLQQIGAGIFGAKPAYDVSWVFSFLIVCFICLLAGYVLSKKVKGVEIVS